MLAYRYLNGLDGGPITFDPKSKIRLWRWGEAASSLLIHWYEILKPSPMSLIAGPSNAQLLRLIKPRPESRRPAKALAATMRMSSNRYSRIILFSGSSFLSVRVKNMGWKLETLIDLRRFGYTRNHLKTSLLDREHPRRRRAGHCLYHSAYQDSLNLVWDTTNMGSCKELCNPFQQKKYRMILGDALFC